MAVRPTLLTMCLALSPANYYDINPVSEFPRHMEIDFEKYSIPASGMGAVHNSTNASYTIAEENGDKYLSFSKKGNSGWTSAYALVLNPNGKAKDNSEKGSYKMENGATYRVSFRYKLSSADGSCSGDCRSKAASTVSAGQYTSSGNSVMLRLVV